MARRTARDTDLGSGFFVFVENTDLREEFGHRLFPDGTGIDDDQVGFVKALGEFVRFFPVQFCDHMFAVPNVHCTSKCFDK